MNTYYWAIPRKAVDTEPEVLLYKRQIMANGVNEKELRIKIVNGKYRLIRKVYHDYVINSGYHNLSQWITRLKKDTIKVKGWLKVKKRSKRCLK
ncbi:hypothetical protein ES707_05424 [subsurface metagenome]